MKYDICYEPNVAEKSCPMTPELNERLCKLKSNVMKKFVLPEDCWRPSKKQKISRCARLQKLLDNLASTNIGRQILSMTPPSMKIISATRPGGEMAAYYDELEMVNFCPSVFKDFYRSEQVNTLVHELVHAINARLAYYTLGSDICKLNPYDRFCLAVMDEAAASIAGQKTAGQYLGLTQMTILTASVFKEPFYWNDYYANVLESAPTKAKQLRLEHRHTPEYYKVWRAYFEMHPDLMYAPMMRHVHKAFCIFESALKKDLMAPNRPKKITKEAKEKRCDYLVHHYARIASRLGRKHER